MLHKTIIFFSCALFLCVCSSYAMPAKHQQVFSFSKEVHDQLLSEINKCAGKLHEVIDEMLKIIQEGKYKEDDDFKKFVYCTYKSAGYSYDDGTLNLEKSASVYPDSEEELEIMKKCDKERGSTPVDNSFLFFKCHQKNSPYLKKFEWLNKS